MKFEPLPEANTASLSKKPQFIRIPNQSNKKVIRTRTYSEASDTINAQLSSRRKALVLLSPSARSHKVDAFKVMQILEEAKSLEASGANIVHLEIGQPDLEPPEEVRQALYRAVKDGETGYTHSQGHPRLREAISKVYSEDYGTSVDPDSIVVTMGTSPALLLALGALIDPGDEVIITDPGYACYAGNVEFLGGSVSRLQLTADSGFIPDPQALRELISPKTKAFIINSPSNPTGRTIPRSTLFELISACEESGVTVISDEIYHGMSYSGAVSHSAREHSKSCFVLNGFSKMYAMPGWRLGFVIVPETYRDAIHRMQQNFFLCANNFVQWAGLAAIEIRHSFTHAMVAEYDKRRQYLVPELRRLGLGVPVDPDGAFYVLADATRFGNDSMALARHILKTTKVAVAPGIDFGSSAEGYIRFSYANSLDNLKEAVTRLSELEPL